MSVDLRGKTVLVTGVTGQVGWGVAHAALDAGAKVVLPVLSAEGLAAVTREFPGEQALVVRNELSSLEAVERLRGEAVERFGAVDHVVAPLGAWWHKGASLEQPADELRALLDTYVEAQWRLVKAMAPALRARSGSYTIVTGVAGEASNMPGAGLLIVAVSAQLALSRMLRVELAHEPFRLNEVRIATRVERAPRPGVVPAREAGTTFLEVLGGEARGALFRYDGRAVTIDPEHR